MSFVGLYEGIRERVLEGKSLPAQDMYQLVESVKNVEQVRWGFIKCCARNALARAHAHACMCMSMCIGV